MGQKIQSAVFGASGYSGFELVRLLARHDGAKKPILFSRNGDSAFKDLSEGGLLLAAGVEEPALSLSKGPLFAPTTLLRIRARL